MKTIELILAVCLGALLLLFVDQWRSIDCHKREKQELAHIADLYQDRLERTLEARLGAVDTFRILLTLHFNPSEAEFKQFAEVICRFNPSITKLQYAVTGRGPVYRYVSQKSEQVAADSCTLPPNSSAYMALASRKSQTEDFGPVRLSVSGMDLAVQMPILRQGQFSGEFTATVDLALLERTAFGAKVSDPVNVRLTDGGGRLIYGPSAIDDAWETRRVAVAGQSWNLALGRARRGFFAEDRRVDWFFGAGLCLALFWVFQIQRKQKKELARKVAACTESLTRRNKELRREVKEQKQLQVTIREQEKALRRAHKMDALGTLAGGVAHEFNNILGIILGNAELALEDMSPWHSAGPCLKEIRSACLRGRQVGLRILTFLNKVHADKAPVEVGPCVCEAVALFQESLLRDIRIENHITCGGEMISANTSDIRQLVLSLCANAAQALGDACGTIEISLETVRLDPSTAESYEVAPGRYAKFCVADNGCGMEAGILERIFEPYFTTRKQDGGLGMGLAVAYGIVKSFDGAICAHSRPGQGTIMEVLLPLLVR